MFYIDFCWHFCSRISFANTKTLLMFYDQSEVKSAWIEEILLYKFFSTLYSVSSQMLWNSWLHSLIRYEVELNCKVTSSVADHIWKFHSECSRYHIGLDDCPWFLTRGHSQERRCLIIKCNHRDLVRYKWTSRIWGCVRITLATRTYHASIHPLPQSFPLPIHQTLFQSFLWFLIWLVQTFSTITLIGGICVWIIEYVRVF